VSENAFSAFPVETQKAVEGLIWLGHLEETFTFCGHRFTIRTLKGEEDLMAGLLAKDYADSLGQAKAWAWANVAMCVKAVDGKTDFCPPIGPDPEDHARAKFRYVTSQWYWPLGEYIFERFSALVHQQREAIQAVQDLSNRSLQPSMPSRDFLTGQGDSPEPMSTDDSN
jgi:hypothetical protein